MNEPGRHTGSGPMDAETLEALRGSIAKWEGIVAGTVVDECGDNCPLCQRFNPVINPAVRRQDACRGCPVMAATGEKFCYASPYGAYAALDDDCDGDEAELKALAQAELDFLKSLLPPESDDLQGTQP